MHSIAEISPKAAQVAITLLPGIGNMLTRQLISYLGSAEAVMSAPKSKLLQVPNIGELTAKAIIDARPSALIDAKYILEKAEAGGDEILFYTDAAYPERLQREQDAPILLYYKGTNCLNEPKMIGIVGTRNPSAYGIEITKALIEGLKEYKPVIVSGLAYGIDITAHQAAFEAGLATIACMANGTDKIYPAKHKKLAQDIQANGGILTEYIYGTVAESHHFPARNRILAGLCDCIVIVEATEKGGSLISADLASGYNRDVFAFPGPVTSETSVGTNKLLVQQKAACITSAQDLVEAMNWDLQDAKANKRQKIWQQKEIDLSTYTEEQQKILNFLLQFPDSQIDAIARSLALPMSELASELLLLEFSGIVNQKAGKKFSIKHNS